MKLGPPSPMGMAFLAVTLSVLWLLMIIGNGATPLRVGGLIVAIALVLINLWIARDT